MSVCLVVFGLSPLAAFAGTFDFDYLYNTDPGEVFTGYYVGGEINGLTPSASYCLYGSTNPSGPWDINSQIDAPTADGSGIVTYALTVGGGSGNATFGPYSPSTWYYHLDDCAAGDTSDTSLTFPSPAAPATGYSFSASAPTATVVGSVEGSLDFFWTNLTGVLLILASIGVVLTFVLMVLHRFNISWEDKQTARKAVASGKARYWP